MGIVPSNPRDIRIYKSMSNSSQLGVIFVSNLLQPPTYFKWSPNYLQQVIQSKCYGNSVTLSLFGNNSNEKVCTWLVHTQDFLLPNTSIWGSLSLRMWKPKAMEDQLFMSKDENNLLQKRIINLSSLIWFQRLFWVETSLTCLSAS